MAMVVRVLEGVGRTLVPYLGIYFDQRQEMINIQGREADTRARNADTARAAVEVVDYLARTLLAALGSGAVGIIAIHDCDIKNWSYYDTSVGCSIANGLGLCALGICVSNLGCFSSKMQQEKNRLTKKAYLYLFSKIWKGIFYVCYKKSSLYII